MEDRFPALWPNSLRALGEKRDKWSTRRYSKPVVDPSVRAHARVSAACVHTRTEERET